MIPLTYYEYVHNLRLLEQLAAVLWYVQHPPDGVASDIDCNMQVLAGLPCRQTRYSK